MQALTAAFFAAHPELSLGALGVSANETALDLAPFGRAARFFAAERWPDLIDRYRAVSRHAFPGELALPGWVLSDLYLMPGVIGLLLGPASTLPPALRARLGLHPDDEAITAAYVAVPSLTPGVFIGVSLISLISGIGAGSWIKILTLKMIRAKRVRGIAQWSSPSVRVHARLGPLRLIGAVPGAHELKAQSFVYESDLTDESCLREAVEQRLVLVPARRIPKDDLPALRAVLARAEAGETLFLVPPGLTASGEILIHEPR